jgi:membrane-associated protease RseP (regulator of RpoE activity)
MRFFFGYVFRRTSAYLIGLLLLSTVIAIHESGHLAAAKTCGVHCKDFSIGFGPGVKVGQIQETELHLRCIPLGGFVEIAMTPEDLEGVTGVVGETISQQTTFEKVVIFAAGIVANVLTIVACAYVLLHLPRKRRYPDLIDEEEKSAWKAAEDTAKFKNKILRKFPEGPVQIIMYLSKGGMFGVRQCLLEVVLLSGGIALFNILPIPPLDGARIFDALFLGSMLSGSATIEGSSDGSILFFVGGMLFLLSFFAVGLLPSIVQLFRFERALFKGFQRLHG